MNSILYWFATPEWTQVVEALLHSLWQGALVAGVMALLLRKLTDPVLRYRASLVALATVVAAGILTWALINNSPSSAILPVHQQAVVQIAPSLPVAPEVKVINSAIVSARDRKSVV